MRILCMSSTGKVKAYDNIKKVIASPEEIKAIRTEGDSTEMIDLTNLTFEIIE